MGTSSVVVVGKLNQDTPQMSSIDNPQGGSFQDQIQTCLSSRKDPSLCERVGIWGSDRSGDHVEAFGLENRIKGWAERAIMVMDQEAQGLFSLGKFPNQLPGLLRNPGLIGIGGDAREMNLAGTQFDEEEHVECLKKGC